MVKWRRTEQGEEEHNKSSHCVGELFYVFIFIALRRQTNDDPDISFATCPFVSFLEIIKFKDNNNFVPSKPY
jgi:hypothetical protein